ncbi:MAG: FAD-dependent oxidoreductase [Cytophagaceae bacterium]|nr:FAD-dependent oxidoreductase [Cytophagaceae bacterium]
MSTFNRRKFLGFILLGMVSIPLIRALISWIKQTTPILPGTLKTASYKVGHLLWNMPLKKISRIDQADYVIVGSGISALSAALALKNQGDLNFKILELEEQAGGNSRYGSNAHGKFPLGAHYLPIPSPSMKELIVFLKSAGVIEKENEDGSLTYNEEYLCSAPEDRLFIHGKWQSGLIPDFGVPENDRQQIKRFIDFTNALKQQKGNDDKYLFDFPLDRSSSDEAFRKLDNVTMKEYLLAEGYTSDYLHWYVDYSCKDDYGTGISDVSAWAGLHYFCARRGTATNGTAHDVLTWPEGNGWLVDKMRQQLEGHFITQALAYQVNEKNDLLEVDYLNVKTSQPQRIQCKKVILCCPQFVIKHFRSNIPELAQRPYNQFDYSSWMVANITVKNTLEEKSGADLSWDNVLYNSPSLGYINSSHQHLNRYQPVLNFTYYRLFDAQQYSRKKILQTQHSEWADLMLKDMRKVYPALEKNILNFEPFVWGHAMIKPVKHFIWGAARKEAKKSIRGKIYFAHTDLSGISTFEEGFYQGIQVVQSISTS